MDNRTWNCLNLVEPESLLILKKAYEDIERIYAQAGKTLPVNDGNYLPGEPGVVLPKYKTVIFVHGCFFQWCEINKNCRYANID